MIYTNEIIKKKINKKDKIKKILKILLLPFFILFILLVIYIGYLKFINKNNDINILGFRQYMVLTGSMEPKFNVGDLIFTKEKNMEDIKINDVITFTPENGTDTVTHRVIEIIKKDGQILYRTKGDNNNSIDTDLVKYNQIKGTVIFKINKLGIIIAHILSHTGIICIILLLILSYLHSSRKEEKRIAREDARQMRNIPKYEKEDFIC